MSLGEDGRMEKKTIYGLGMDESDVSWTGAGGQVADAYSRTIELGDKATKDFCDKHENLWFCHFRDFFIMLAIVIIGMLILYVFITIINNTTKKHFIKSIYKIKR